MQLRAWWKTELNTDRHDDSPLPPSVTSFSDVRITHYFDLTCQVVAVCEINPPECCLLKVWDGTKIKGTWHYTWKHMHQFFSLRNDWWSLNRLKIYKSIMTFCKSTKFGVLLNLAAKCSGFTAFFFQRRPGTKFWQRQWTKSKCNYRMIVPNSCLLVFKI